MTEGTALFLARLSHQWFLEVLPLPIVFGVAMHYAGVLRAHTRFGTNAFARRIGVILRTVSCVLFAGSLAVCAVAFMHLGCAAMKAHEAQCQSNLKQLAMGAAMYAQDYDERLPPATRWAEAIDTHVTQAARSDTYAHGDPFQCPAAESVASYGMNAVLSGLSQSEIFAPADTVQLFDADAPRRSFAGGAQDVAWKRHGEMPNVTFADGHVKSANPFVRKNLNWASTETNVQQ